MPQEMLCSRCGKPQPPANNFCANCGSRFPQISGEPSAGAAEPQVRDDVSAAIPDNIIAALAYFTIIPAVLLLLFGPYKRDRFVRFHSFNCLFLHVAVLAAGLALWALAVLVGPSVRVLFLLVAGIFVLAGFTLWLLLVVKAYQHEVFKLPVIGDMAEKLAGA